MKESHNEGLASHIGPESCGGVCEGAAEALTWGGMDWVLSLENIKVRSADGFASSEGNTVGVVIARPQWAPRGRQTPATYRHTSRERRQAALLGTMSSFTEAGRSPGSAPMRIGVRVVNPQGARRR